jgi:hypothetical protein
MVDGYKNFFPGQIKVILFRIVKHFRRSSAAFKSIHTKSEIFFKFVASLRISSNEL